MVFLRIIRQKRFIFGFLILFLILFASFTFKSLIEPNYPIKTVYWLYNESHMLIGKAPFPPSASHPLGSDPSGVPIEMKLIAGAKYTFGIALGITVIRFILGLFLGVILSFLRDKTYAFFHYTLNAFNYIPETIIAFIVLAPIDIVFVWSFTVQQQFMITFITLSLIGVPNLSLEFATEIKQVKKREFIETAHVLGGGPLHILLRHVKPFLSAKMILLLKQQMIRVLAIMVALAILGIKITGVTQHVESPNPMTVTNEPVKSGQVTLVIPSTAEWSGMIQEYRGYIWGYRWLLIDPAVAFLVLIISIQLVASAIFRVLHGEDIRRKRRRKKEVKPVEAHPESISFEQWG